MKNIGIISDIHLEGSGIDDIINKDWDYLIIAGDLSANYDSMDKFFAYKAPRDIPILYVLGNHEYEGKRVDTVIEKTLEILAPYPNVILLNNESIVIDGIKFIGSTLWTNFELNGKDEEQIQKNMKWAKGNISDFDYMFTKKEGSDKYTPITPQEMRMESEKAIKFLKKELIETPFDGEKVVITHFAPHEKSVNPSYKNENNSYWVNNLEELMGYSKYWFHGHTHSNYNYEVNGTQVICNPRGHSKLYDIASNFDFDRNASFPIQEKLTKINKNKF